MTTQEMLDLGWVEDGTNYRHEFAGYPGVLIPTADLPTMTADDVLQVVRTALGV